MLGEVRLGFVGWNEIYSLINELIDSKIRGVVSYCVF